MCGRYVVGLCALLFTSTQTARSAEPTQTEVTLAQFAVQGVLERIQVYADFCTDKVPTLGPSFRALMRDLNAKVPELAKPVLASYANDPIVQRATPKALVDAYKEWNRGLREELDGVDAEKQCPTYLTNYRTASDDFFRAGIKHTLGAFKRELAEPGSN